MMILIFLERITPTHETKKQDNYQVQIFLGFFICYSLHMLKKWNNKKKRTNNRKNFVWLYVGFLFSYIYAILYNFIFIFQMCLFIHYLFFSLPKSHFWNTFDKVLGSISSFFLHLFIQRLLLLLSLEHIKLFINVWICSFSFPFQSSSQL